jgi:hypothetical protein
VHGFNSGKKGETMAEGLDWRAIQHALFDHRFSVVDDLKQKRDGVAKWGQLDRGGYMLNKRYELKAEEVMLLLALYLEDVLGAKAARTVGKARLLLEPEKAPLREIGFGFLGGPESVETASAAKLTKLYLAPTQAGCSGAQVDLGKVELQIKLLKDFTPKWAQIPMKVIAESDRDNSDSNQGQLESTLQEMNQLLQSGEYRTFLSRLVGGRLPMAYVVARRLALRRKLAVARLDTMSTLLYKLVMDTSTAPQLVCGDPSPDWKIFIARVSGSNTEAVKVKELEANSVVEDGWAGPMVDMLLATAAPVGLAAGYVAPKTVDFGLRAFQSEGVANPSRTLQVLLNTKLDKAQVIVSMWFQAVATPAETDYWGKDLADLITKLIMS